MSEIPMREGGPQASLYRRVGRLRVVAMGREVRAIEEAPWRYLGFFAVAIASSLYLALETQMPPAIVGINLILWLLLFQPSHRQLLASLDTEDVRLRWLALGFLPIYSRAWSLSESVLRVGTRVETTTQSGSVPTGCLALALPFPLSLIAMLFGKSQGSATSEEIPTLRLDGLEEGRELLCLVSRAVPLEFLREVEAMTPGAVELPWIADAEAPDPFA